MKKSLINLLKLLVTCLIFIVIYKRFNLNLNQIFVNINWFPYLLVGLVIRLIVMQSIFIFRWKLFLKHSGIDEHFFKLMKIGFMASFYGIVLPSSQGNDMMRMFLIEKQHPSDEKHKTSSSSVLIERMLGIVLLALTGLISSLLVPEYPTKWRVVVIISIISLSLFGFLFFITNKLIYSIVSRLLSRISILKKLTAFLEKTHFSIVSFPYKKVIIPATILIFLMQACSISIVYFVFLSFGIDLPFYQHISYFPIITIMSVLPIAISGLGLRESFFVYFYAFVGISPEIAVGVSLTNYALQTLSAACVGGVIVLSSRTGKKKLTS